MCFLVSVFSELGGGFGESILHACVRHIVVCCLPVFLSKEKEPTEKTRTRVGKKRQELSKFDQKDVQAFLLACLDPGNCFLMCGYGEVTAQKAKCLAAVQQACPNSRILNADFMVKTLNTQLDRYDEEQKVLEDKGTTGNPSMPNAGGPNADVLKRLSNLRKAKSETRTDLGVKKERQRKAAEAKAALTDRIVRSGVKRPDRDGEEGDVVEVKMEDGSLAKQAKENATGAQRAKATVKKTKAKQTGLAAVLEDDRQKRAHEAEMKERDEKMREQEIEVKKRRIALEEKVESARIFSELQEKGQMEAYLEFQKTFKKEI